MSDKRIVFDKATGREIRRWYDSGMSLRELKEQFGGSNGSLTRAIKESGGTMRSAGITPDMRARSAETKRRKRMDSSIEPQPHNSKDVDRETLGGRIRSVRLSMGLTQRDFSQLIGVHEGTISRLEHNLRSVSPEVLNKIVEVSGKPLEFFGVSEWTPTEEQMDVVRTIAGMEYGGPLMEEARASVALDGDTHVVGEPKEVLLELESRLGPNPLSPDDPPNVHVQDEPESPDLDDQREAADYGFMSVLCYDDQHDRCKAEWCTCPHHSVPRFLAQEAEEAEAVAEREQSVYDAEREYDVRLSIASYLRKAAAVDSRLVGAFVRELADQIMAGADKR